MATTTKKTSIKSLYDPISNPSGGLVFQPQLPGNSSPVSIRDLFNFGTTKTSTPATIGIPAAPKAPIVAAAPAISSSLGKYKGVEITGDPKDQVGIQKQMAAIDSAQGGGSPAAAAGPTGATGAGAVSIPSNFLKPDGSFYSPDEITANIEKTAGGLTKNGDVGKLAGDQFGGTAKTTADLENDARGINNARNDLAVGATDPYKIASKSGIQYTPEELGAIEKAYAGVYDPALAGAMTKLEAKQKSDADQADMDQKLALQKSAPFSLGKDEVRYDGDGNPIAVGISSATGDGGTYTQGSNPTVDAYITGIQNGTYKPSDVPDEYKALVAQGMSANQPAVSKTSTDAISVINSLIGQGDDVLAAISGLPGTSSFFPGTKAAAAENLAKQLNGILSLANRQQLKGQGAISDFEFKVLGDASSALGIGENGKSNLSNEEFKKALGNLKVKLSVGPTSLTDDEVLHLVDSGFSPDEIRAKYGPSPQSFNSVGNTTASTSGKNVPQRNNNPGNVKGGGLADSLAVGKDNQGHLIFKNSIDGFKALTLDLTAKVNGASAHLPKNPTLAQLGKVYAEDPNWPKKVAGFLGVPVDTHTATIPISQLAQAVARQEGFYA